MSTLCDFQIRDLCQEFSLVDPFDDSLINPAFSLVDPFDDSLINPASIDLRVGEMARLEQSHMGYPAHDSELWGGAFPLGDGYLLKRGESILLDTMEYVRIPPRYMAEMWLKSSAGRNGGDMYKAGYIDPGFHGTLTFRYRNDMRRPILIKPGIRLVQMVVREMSAMPERPYTETGRYAGQTEPQPAR